jgi:phosphopentomutase
VLDAPFPTYPNGFPAAVLADFSARTGRPVIGNVVASGTAIIDELGAAHLASGAWIVYTSADSVFQVAAHEERCRSRAVRGVRDRAGAAR